MKRHKNLERVIVLSLLMSSSIYGTVFASSYEENDNFYGVGGENGYSTSYTPQNKNFKNFFIAGYNTGIRINGSATLKFTATDSTYIGKCTDENGTEHISNKNGIYVANSGKLNITATNNNSIYGGEDGIYGMGKNVNIEIKGNNNDIYGVSKGAVDVIDGAMATITAVGENNIKSDLGVALGASDESEIKVTGRANTIATEGRIAISTSGKLGSSDSGKIIVTATNGDNLISVETSSGKALGISSGSYDVVELIAEEGVNKITADSGIIAEKVANVSLTAKKNIIKATSTNSTYGAGIEARNTDTKVELIADDENYIESNIHAGVRVDDEASVTLTVTNGDNKISSVLGIWGTKEGTANLSANNNIINTTSYGIYASDSDVILTANQSNVVSDKDKNEYGSVKVINAFGGSTVELNAIKEKNIVSGLICAKDNGTTVRLIHNASKVDTMLSQLMSDSDIDNIGEKSNIITSGAYSTKKTSGTGVNTVSAVYAQNQGKIDIIAGAGGNNYIETSYTTLDDSEDSTDSERTVWAQRGGIVNIEGTTIIKSSNAEDFYDENGYATNSRGVAITAGSGEKLDIVDEKNGYGYKDKDGIWHAFYENGVLANVKDVLGCNSEVELNYGAGSQIYGDIVAGYGGKIDIKQENNLTRANENNGLYMEGNALAANDGELTIDLGNGGIWYGRADDYGDAGYGEDAKDKQNFYNPVFSDTIYTGGNVNINMGEGSKWYLTGQSWVSSLNVSQGNGDVTIDMERFNKGTHGLTISELKGNSGGNVDATFVMDLDHNAHNTSDMLYIKNGIGEYDVVLNDVIDGMENINEDNVLRFATVQGGASFNSVTMKDQGMYNLGFEIDHSEYDTTDEENKDYNGTSVDTNKPGNENVEGFFGLGNEEENTSKIMLLDEVDSAADDSIQNWYITKVLGQGLSDAGKTVLNMSRANYSQAVYMDTLNKRLGEARYLEGDEGLWIRMRHDKIDKDSSYEITNNMYELGYDKKYESKDKNGYHRRGVAIDYMDGDTSYDDIAGSGEINRKGIWLYDTWIGNKGHYTDYVAKWGHLENSFDLYTKTAGEKVSGEYDNDVYSLSAEWGYKDQLNNDWYIEPQVQLQYARVTGADYETSQGTQVSVDGIDSLIARAGFRLGKDFGEEKKSTFYVKADVLHEFLGDQDITAIDKTTNGAANIGYDNDGTWYSVGLGFSTMLSDNSYAFLDVEKLFGNDNDNSYQINGGFNWLL